LAQKVRRRSRVPRHDIEDLAYLYYDVGGYLASPFFAIQVFPDRYRDVTRKGYAMRLVGEILYKLNTIAKRKRFHVFKFSIEVMDQNGEFHRVSLDELVSLAREVVHLHRNGLRHILDYTPDAVSFFKEHYVESTKAKPIHVETFKAYPLNQEEIRKRYSSDTDKRKPSEAST
jgi:hypothetical protein